MPLIAHYPLDEDTGTTAYDHSGNGNDGTVTGATLGATGLLGGSAYSFDGTDDIVDLPTFPAFNDGSAGWALSFWIYRASTDSSNGIIYFRDGYFGPYHISDGTSDTFRTYDGTTAYDITDTERPTNRWVHYLFQATGPAGVGGLELYRDGSLFGTNANWQTTTSTANNTLMGTSADNVNGSLAHVRLYNHALTPSEVQYLYDVSTRGTILVDERTHTEAIMPDLRTDVTLNTESATAYLVGSPGTASEEVNRQTLSDGSADYPIAWANTHTTFRVRVVADLADPTNRVAVNSLALLA